MEKEPTSLYEIALAEIEITYRIEKRRMRMKFAILFAIIVVAFAGRIIAPDGSTLFYLAGWLQTATNLFIAYTSIDNYRKLRKMEAEEAPVPVTLKRMAWGSLGIAAINIVIALTFLITEVV